MNQNMSQEKESREEQEHRTKLPCPSSLNVCHFYHGALFV